MCSLSLGLRILFGVVLLNGLLWWAWSPPYTPDATPGKRDHVALSVEQTPCTLTVLSGAGLLSVGAGIGDPEAVGGVKPF